MGKLNAADIEELLQLHDEIDSKMREIHPDIPNGSDEKKYFNRAFLKNESAKGYLNKIYEKNH